MLKTVKPVVGVGMVEVLVAMVVVGVGLLGVASLYITTLQAKTTAQSRMKAINFAYDMADRIRANREGKSSYALALTGSTAAPASTANCVATVGVTCTPAQMASNDLYLWDQMVTDTIKGLPGAGRAVTYTAPPTGTAPAKYKIDLQWSERNGGAQSYSLEIQI